MVCIAALGTPCLPSRRRWQQLLLLSGLVWGLVIISPDFARVFSPLSRFGMTIDNDGLVLAVDASWPSPSATICCSASSSTTVMTLATRSIPRRRSCCATSPTMPRMYLVAEFQRLQMAGVAV